MKISIYGGEAFPIYRIYSSGFCPLEVDEETLSRWKAVFDKFTEVQEEIIATMKKQGHAEKIWYGGVWSGYNMEIDNED